NSFCIVLGLFLSSLFAFLASVYLIGETEDSDLQEIFFRKARVSSGMMVFLGAGVFLTAQWEGFPLLREFFQSPLSIACFSGATLLLTPFWIHAVRWQSAMGIRMLGAILVALVLLGWYSVQYPAILRLRDGGELVSLSFAEVAAPQATLRVL